MTCYNFVKCIQNEDFINYIDTFSNIKYNIQHNCLRKINKTNKIDFLMIILYYENQKDNK